MQDMNCAIRHKSDKANLVNLPRIAKCLALFIICYHVRVGAILRILPLFICLNYKGYMRERLVD